MSCKIIKTPHKSFIFFTFTSCLLLLAESSLYAKESIDKLTSNATFRKVSDKIPQKQEGPRIPNRVNRHSIGVGLGQTTLNSDFEKNGDDSITWDLYYTYSASHSFSLLINFHSFEHKYKRKKTSVDLTAAVVGLKAHIYHIDSFSPVLIGGLGFYRPVVKQTVNDQNIESENKIVFGAHLGAGAELNLNSHFSVGILGHYHDPFDVKQEIGSTIEGSYFKLLITGFYTF